MEKVHSAVIGWMLSDKCEAFGEGDHGRKIRSELLQKIFGIQQDFEHFDSIDSMLEWKDIDILIVTTKDKIIKCWVIENKIKSSQHSNQLNRYVDTINCPYLLSSLAYRKICEIRDGKEEEPTTKERKIDDFIQGLSPQNKPLNGYSQVDKRFCFLTLIEEEPVCTRDSVSWVNTKYGDLCNYLSEARRINNNQGKDQIILDEYFNCISVLNKAINDFQDHYSDYDNVFNDGQKQKEVKMKQWADPRFTKPIGKYARLISDNSLETIFQKLFLKQLIPKTAFFNNDISSFNISETRGNALVDFTHEKIGYVSFGYQFQNGTFKVQIVDKGMDGEEFSRRCFDYFKKNVLPDLEGEWTINPSKKNKTPYLSISMKRDPVWYKGNIIEKWNNAYKKCSSIMPIVKEHYRALQEKHVSV